ncbi:MAG: FkbM family methyltransferase [Alphaproteobacteria bacterium]|nr:FkbM family methyltransferase [Alphaproteobacteria bacterium]
MNALDLTTRSGKSIVDIAIAPLLERGVEPILVDAGARGGMHDLPASYARHIHLIGFEPNPEEFAKLVEHNTDAQREGHIPPRWKKESFKDVALWDKAETRPLYITNDTGAITLMGELAPNICNNIYSGFAKIQGGGGAQVLTALTDIRKMLSVEEIKCDSLDNIMAIEGSQGVIDFLKIDVEGAETRVLQGARAARRRPDPVRQIGISMRTAL